jgi:predicted Zn-dependent protease
MQHRRSVFALGRVAGIVGTALAAAAALNCSAYTATGRDGTLDGFTEPRRAPGDFISREAVLSAAPGTYIEQVLADRDSTIERWPARVAQPIRVWIDSTPLLSGPQTNFPEAVRSAFDTWGKAGIPVRFAFVPSSHDADIRVHWTTHLDHKTGSTTWRTDRNGWLTQGDITLATHISDGMPLDSRGMRAIALHEVGHSLGLSHSLNPQDIMAPLIRVDVLSLSDRNTIKLLYSFPAGPIH